MLGVIKSIIEELLKNSVKHCHWKSNFHLDRALSGKDDWDVLVDSRHYQQFQEIILEFGAKPARSRFASELEGIDHYYAIDPDSGITVHIHSYSKIYTGDSLIKSYALPIEALLLPNIRKAQMQVPSKEAELLSYLLRYSMKLNSPLDLYFLRRDKSNVKSELEWLLDGFDKREFSRLKDEYFPSINNKYLEKIMERTLAGEGISRSIYDAIRINHHLRHYRRISWIATQYRTMVYVIRVLYHKFRRRGKFMTLGNDGKVITFIGPQAVGKTTLSQMLTNWLRQDFAVYSFHVGKPPATALTFVPRLFLPFMRKMFPKARSTSVEMNIENPKSDFSFPYMHVVRKIILAHERVVLLRKIYRMAEKGGIVVCDRYPTQVVGAVDGATFDDETISQQKSKYKRYLMKLERNIYLRVKPPNIVIKLHTDLHTAIERNLSRKKEGSQDSEYVEFRHKMKRQPAFNDIDPIVINTNRPIEETFREVQSEVWSML
jgi:thymidylate kinase